MEFELLNAMSRHTQRIEYRDPKAVRVRREMPRPGGIC